MPMSHIRMFRLSIRQGNCEQSETQTNVPFMAHTHSCRACRIVQQSGGSAYMFIVWVEKNSDMSKNVRFIQKPRYIKNVYYYLDCTNNDYKYKRLTNDTICLPAPFMPKFTSIRAGKHTALSLLLLSFKSHSVAFNLTACNAHENKSASQQRHISNTSQTVYLFHN